MQNKSGEIKMAEEIKNGMIMTVFSTASAVGKTLLSINMTAELAKSGYRVCVVDLDLQFGDICNYLKISPQKTIYDFQKNVENEQSTLDCQDYITQYEYQGISFSVLAAPRKMEEAYNISTQAVIAILSGLRSEYDYIVLDTTAAFSELNLAAMDLSTIITFVGIVDFIPTIKNMKVGYDTMRSIGYEKNKIRFILNRNNSKTHIELQDVEQLLEEHFYHVLPNDFFTAMDSLHKGIPLVIDRDTTALGQSLQDLIDKYTNRMRASDTPNAPLSSWMKKLFK